MATVDRSGSLLIDQKLGCDTGHILEAPACSFAANSCFRHGKPTAQHFPSCALLLLWICGCQYVVFRLSKTLLQHISSRLISRVSDFRLFVCIFICGCCRRCCRCCLLIFQYSKPLEYLLFSKYSVTHIWVAVAGNHNDLCSDYPLGAIGARI